MLTADRLRMPSARLEMPHTKGLSRERLLHVLNGIGSPRLGLVVAPAGFGKTTLMAQWAGTTGHRVAWYRAEHADTAPGRLLQRLNAVLARVEQAEHRTADGASEAVPGGTQMTGIEDLVVRIERASTSILLVVDDLHVLADSTAEVDLERLLLLAPPQLHVLVGSRRRPAFNLARAELRTPVMLTSEDLTFRFWEVERLFREVYAAPLRPDDAAALTRRTAGWAAALQMFHLSILGRAPAERRRAVRALTGRSRYAQDYLSGQVLATLPESLRRFLRLTCVFEVLTGERCDALLGGHEGQRTLLELERRQALTTSDDEGATFVYHEVLRRHLETALHEELGRTGAGDWYRRAASVLEAQGSVAEALRARCRGEDWDGVRRLLQDDGARLADASASGWTELVPSWLTNEDPWVSLAEARRLLDDGQLISADHAARRAEQQFSDSVGQNLCRTVIRRAGTWLAAPQRPDSQWDDVLRSATRRNPMLAAEAAHGLDDRLGYVVEGVALGLAGDVRGAESVLRRCCDDPASEPRTALVARLALASIAALVDDTPETAAALDFVQLDAERRGLTWLARVARGVASARGAERRDIEVADGVVDDCEQRGDAWGAALVSAAAGIAQLRAGHPDVAALERLASRFRALDAGVLEAWTRAAHALAAATDELPEAAAEARTAESFARSAGVPGALAMAYAALAYTRPEQCAELLSLADSSAQAAGLLCRPWGWLSTPPHSASPATAATRTSHVTIPAQRIASRRLEVACLGGFRLTVDGSEPDLAGVRPLARASLRLLALHAGRPVHRELLADALWGELDTGAAMHNLQVAISSLRASLEPGVPGRANRVLVRDGETYTLVLGTDSVADLRSFDSALSQVACCRATGDSDAAIRALRRAMDLYTGDVLPEDGPAEWVIAERERYRLQAAEATATLAELELQRGDPAAAVFAASRSIQIERWRDQSWRTLIEAHERAGDHANAERSRRAYGDVLASMGV